MTARALAYAEDTLGVHAVWEDAKLTEGMLSTINEQLKKLAVEKRRLNAQVTQREGDLMVDERGKHPDHSQAAFDRHLKIVYHTDPELVQLRRQLLDNAFEIDQFEFDARSREHQLRLLVARLEQLGGYLTYLAAVKTGQQGLKTTETK